MIALYVLASDKHLPPCRDFVIGGIVQIIVSVVEGHSFNRQTFWILNSGEAPVYGESDIANFGLCSDVRGNSKQDIELPWGRTGAIMVELLGGRLVGGC